MGRRGRGSYLGKKAKYLIKKEVKRQVRENITTNLIYDGNRAEVATLISKEELLKKIKVDELLMNLIPDLEKGEIVYNSRNNGSFQKRKFN